MWVFFCFTLWMFYDWGMWHFQEGNRRPLMRMRESVPKAQIEIKQSNLKGYVCNAKNGTLIYSIATNLLIIQKNILISGVQEALWILYWTGIRCTGQSNQIISGDLENEDFWNKVSMSVFVGMLKRRIFNDTDMMSYRTTLNWNSSTNQKSKMVTLIRSEVELVIPNVVSFRYSLVTGQSKIPCQSSYTKTFFCLIFVIIR